MLLHPLADDIIRKGAFLSWLLLSGALVLTVWTCACPDTFLRLRHYIAQMQRSAALVLAAALPGGFALELLLRRT